MKKIFAFLMLLSLAQAHAQTKCDWKDFKCKQTRWIRNYREFGTKLYKDTCIKYTWLVYDFQSNKTDTIRKEIFPGVIGVYFKAHGTHRVSIHAVNKCNNCDTTFNSELVYITFYGESPTLDYTVSDSNCRTWSFEMSEINYSCNTYKYEIYNATEFTKNLTDEEWSNTSDSIFKFTGGFDVSPGIYYSQESERILEHTFQDSGRFLILGYWNNSCSEMDTFRTRKITVCPEELRASSKQLIKNSDIKIIGYYDMLGRQVEYVRPNEVYIYLYSNGERKKIIQIQN